jgi:hypothetical protein
LSQVVRTRPIASLTLLVVLAICQHAQAARPLDLAPAYTASGVPRTDGHSWGIVPVRFGMFVLDARGRRLVTRPVELGGPCGSQAGYPRGVGGGLALIECSFLPSRPSPRLLVYDLAAGTFTVVAGTAVLLRSAEGNTIDGIGRTWMLFNELLHDGGSVPALLDWRTGRAAPAPALAADRVLDLDAPSGSRRLCRPIRRLGSRKRLFAYRPPFALSERGKRGRTVLVLERCKGRALRLTKPGVATAPVSLGARAVAWVEGTTIHARSLRNGRERRWRIPGTGQVFGLAEVGDQLLVTVQSGVAPFDLIVERGRLS